MVKGSSSKQGARIIWGVLLTFILVSSLILSFAVPGYAAPTVTRTLPATVTPGETFDVTITFTSTDNDFNAIGLSDFAPVGWTITGDNAMNTPNSDQVLVTGNRIDYVWIGPYSSGAIFTAVYRVTVPASATGGTYDFNTSPQLEYYVGQAGPFVESIGGANSVLIEESAPTVPGSSNMSMVLLTAGFAVLIAVFSFRKIKQTRV